MKKTQKLHRKKKSSNIRNTQKLQKGGIRSPFTLLKQKWKNWRKVNHQPQNLKPVVTYNPGFNKNRYEAQKEMREYSNLSGYTGSENEPKSQAVYSNNKKYITRVDGEISGPYAQVEKAKVG